MRVEEGDMFRCYETGLVYEVIRIHEDCGLNATVTWKNDGGERGEGRTSKSWLHENCEKLHNTPYGKQKRELII